MQLGSSICATVKFPASIRPNDSYCDDWTWDRLSSIQRVFTGEGHSTRSWGDTWTGYFLLWMPLTQTGKYCVVFSSTGLSV
jgi:hypothetical protein